MPIHTSILKPRQAEAGRIKIGRLGEERDSQHGSKYQLPEKQDYFTLTTNERGDDGNFEEDGPLTAELTANKECVDSDGRIRRLPIMLSSDIIEEVFPTTLSCYMGKSLHCRGDGETATRYEMEKKNIDNRPVMIKTGRSKTMECPCPYLGATQGNQCKPHGTLWCTIVAGGETQIGARHSFRTTSWESIRSILAGLQEIQRMVGTLVGVPLWLYLMPRKTRPKGSTKSVMTYVAHVRCKAQDIQALSQRVLQHAQLRHNVARIAGQPLRLGLAAPGEGEDDVEQAYLQQEFHPEGTVIDGDVVDPAPQPEDESQDASGEEEVLHVDHEARRKLQEMLRVAAQLRGFEGPHLGKGQNEIFAEAICATGIDGINWRSLTLSQASSVATQIEKIIDAQKNRE